MKNDIYAELYSKGTQTGKSYTESVDSKKRKIRNLVLGIGLPALLAIGYQFLPSKLSRDVTAEDRITIEQDANEKKVESSYSNAKLYDAPKILDSLESAFQSERPENLWTKDEEQIVGLVKNGADVLAYHSVGRVLNERVVSYDQKNIRSYSPTVRAVTRNPHEFLEDLNQSMGNGKGTVIALIGSGREHYNILPDGKTIDPNCSFGIIDEFKKAHPTYANKIKVVFFHPNSQDPLFGQPEYEEEKYGHIAKTGGKNAVLGINLGKEDLAKPLITENGWKDGEFWAEGPGITNFSEKQISLDRRITESKLNSLGKDSGRSNFYWLPWSTIPKDKNAVREISKSYGLVFLGYGREKIRSKSQRIIPAKIMGGK